MNAKSIFSTFNNKSRQVKFLFLIATVSGVEPFLVIALTLAPASNKMLANLTISSFEPLISLIFSWSESLFHDFYPNNFFAISSALS